MGVAARHGSQRALSLFVTRGVAAATGAAGPPAMKTATATATAMEMMPGRGAEWRTTTDSNSTAAAWPESHRAAEHREAAANGVMGHTRDLDHDHDHDRDLGRGGGSAPNLGRAFELNPLVSASDAETGTGREGQQQQQLSWACEGHAHRRGAGALQPLGRHARFLAKAPSLAPFALRAFPPPVPLESSSSASGAAAAAAAAASAAAAAAGAAAGAVAATAVLPAVAAASLAVATERAGVFHDGALWWCPRRELSKKAKGKTPRNNRRGRGGDADEDEEDDADEEEEDERATRGKGKKGSNASKSPSSAKRKGGGMGSGSAAGGGADVDGDGGGDFDAQVLLRLMRAHLQESRENLKKELAKIRIGRATPDMLDHVMVDAHGSMVHLPHVATVTVRDPQLLAVTMHDPSLTNSAMKGLRKSPMGLNPSTGADSSTATASSPSHSSAAAGTILVPVPRLTRDVQQAMAKLIGQAVEGTKNNIRRVRKDAMDAVKSVSKIISEDERRRLEKQIQDALTAMTKEIDTIGHAKQKEVLGDS